MEIIKRACFSLLLICLIFNSFSSAFDIKQTETIIRSNEQNNKPIVSKEYSLKYLEYLLESTRFNEKKWVTFSPEQEAFNQTIENVNRTDLLGERSPILKIHLYKRKSCPKYKNTLNGISSLKIGVCNWGNLPTSGSTILLHQSGITSFGQYHNVTTTGNWSINDIDSLSFSLNEILNPGKCSSSLIEIDYLFSCADKTCFLSQFIAYNPDTNTESKNETYLVECKNTKPGPLVNEVQIENQDTICLNTTETNNFTVSYSYCDSDNQIALEGYFHPFIIDAFVDGISIDSYITPTIDSPVCYFNCTNETPIQLVFPECATQVQGFMFSPTPDQIPYTYKIILQTVFQSYNESDPIIVSPYIEFGFSCSPDPALSVITLPPNKAPIIGIIN